MSTLPNTFEAVDEDVERIRERPWESPPTSSVFESVRESQSGK
ncbi:hypothetical protein [Haloferax larsenii]|nr:hypothetical protein [Haloferax larsenii]